ncbi:hypothetical protein [Paraburkholderia caffeinilytica]|uniref:hypothetical protein n=1 Tax=Paraburkholderia caffeinilytica TaxID=1761016 RepID=UPI003DA19F1F
MKRYLKNGRMIILVVVNFIPLRTYAWTDDNPPSVSQCVAADVNDVGTVVENCKISNMSVAFVVISGAAIQLASLPGTAGGVPCSVNMTNNAAVGRETIVGACRDANNVFQAVSWFSGSPGAPIQLRPYAGLLGIIGGGVKTRATGGNLQGIVIGESVDGNGTGLPVFWTADGNGATPLGAPLLVPQANCIPIDINDAKAPSVVGNCPGGGGSGGRNTAVLWMSLSGPYSALPVPNGASYCRIDQIDLAGSILGECIYGIDTHWAAVWGVGGSGSMVLQTVNGNQALRTGGTALNDTGLVAVKFLGSQSHAGMYEPAIWDPADGNINALPITLPPGASHGTIAGLGNNGTMVGNYETAAGTVHPIHVASGSLAAADDGTPAGGQNAVVRACSIGGQFEAGAAEDSNGAVHAEVQPIP